MENEIRTLDAKRLDAESLRKSLAGDKFPANRHKLIIDVGEMADRTRVHDWGIISLGPIIGWSEALVCSVNPMLSCRFPAVIF